MFQHIGINVFDSHGRLLLSSLKNEEGKATDIPFAHSALSGSLHAFAAQQVRLILKESDIIIYEQASIFKN